MKIAVMSDLHLELDARAFDKSQSEAHRKHAFDFYLNPPQPAADVLILAGDIHSGAQGIDWALRSFTLPIAIIGGNHESYGHELFRVIAYNRQRALATGDQVHFLERATSTYKSGTGERVRIVGATLWTDFELYRTPDLSMALAEERIEDFKIIKIERGEKTRTLRPADTARLHRAAVDYLRGELAKSFRGYTVVVTHHAPSPKSVSRRFKGDPLNPAFVSDLEELILAYQPALWIHGHLHESFDYYIGRTRIVCNPRGYFPDELNPRFDPRLVVEIGTGPTRDPSFQTSSPR